MKRFKIGFLAVIAIAAMSFTVAENTGAFKSDARAIEKCYRVISDKLTCTSATQNFVDNTTACPPANLALAKLWAVNSALIYNSVDGAEPTDCSGIKTDFCCVTVVVDDQPCTSPAQPTFNLDGTGILKPYKIVSSFCRP